MSDDEHETRTPPSVFRVLLTLASARASKRCGAHRGAQYRSVVEHLSKELAEVEPGEDLSLLLDSFPATAQLYENLHYAHAGLCRSPLDASLEAEIRARELLQRLQR